MLAALAQPRHIKESHRRRRRGASRVWLAGQYYDAEDGLSYNGPRYYESAKAGFDQPDPIGQAGGIDLYVYCLNNPLTYIDSSGLMPPGAPPPIGPFSPEGPGRIPEAGDIPSGVPGGPWTPAPENSGQRLGTFLGPRQSKGPRAMCRWVPRVEDGGPPGSTGYWETQQPGQSGMDRWDLNGNWQTPEQAHPGNPSLMRPPVEPVEPVQKTELPLSIRIMEATDGEL